MRNREATLRKLDSVESNLTKMGFILNQGDRDACYELIEVLREQVEQIKLYINAEPIIGGELNNFNR